MKLTTLSIVLLAATAGILTAQDRTATDDQVKEIQKVLDKIKDAEKDGKTDEVKKLKKEAITLADKYYKIPQDNADGEPEYGPGTTGEGESEPSGEGGKKVKVKLGEKTFTTPGWLASTKLHEIVGHGGQAAAGHWYVDRKGTAIQEVEAYDLEIENAKKNGLSDAEIADLKKRRKKYYDKLNDDNKKKVDAKNYVLALAPASGNSMGALAGAAQVFVAGVVLAEDDLPVTVRGPNQLTGMVVTAEVGGKTIEARTDAQGHAVLEMGAAAAAVAGTAVALVKVTDSTGKVVATSKFNIEPGVPQPTSQPQISSLPKYIRNGDVVTVPGQNLGSDARLVIGDKFQEPLSASSRQIVAFVDAPKVGDHAAYVLAPGGESPSQTVHCYNFTVHASKSTITRGEHVSAAAEFAGLPVGTQIVLTNTTPNVITMKGLGEAESTGLTSTFRVTAPEGKVNLDLTGQSRGAFAVNYELKFPAQ